MDLLCPAELFGDLENRRFLGDCDYFRGVLVPIAIEESDAIPRAETADMTQVMSFRPIESHVSQSERSGEIETVGHEKLGFIFQGIPDYNT